MARDLDDDSPRAPRPLISCAAEDIAYWSRAWAVDPLELVLAIRRHGPSITAVARAMDRPAGL